MTNVHLERLDKKINDFHVSWISQCNHFKQHYNATYNLAPNTKTNFFWLDILYIINAIYLLSTTVFYCVKFLLFVILLSYSLFQIFPLSIRLKQTSVYNYFIELCIFYSSVNVFGIQFSSWLSLLALLWVFSSFIILQNLINGKKDKFDTIRKVHGQCLKLNKQVDKSLFPFWL